MLHEKGSTGSNNQQVMDLHNNYLGITIAYSITFPVSLEDAILNAIGNGQGRRLNPLEKLTLGNNASIIPSNPKERRL